MAETRYLPYGEERWTSGGAVGDYTFTGQRAERGLDLMDYRARYYDPKLGRFVSADSVVPEPGNPQSLNRYSYVYNNPLRSTDPSGHQCEEGDMPCWEARWYEAHGYNQVDGGWTFTGNFNFWDEGALHELIGDAEHFALSQIAGSSPNNSLPDALGWRLDASAGFILGIDANINMIYNLDQQRLEYGANGWEFTPGDLDVYLSLGGQFLTFGYGASTGPQVLFNLPENDRLTGWGWNLGGTFYPSVGGEAEVFGSLSKEQYPEGDPWGIYLGVGTGEEVSLYGGGGYTWSITKPTIDLLELLSGK